jgi:hypothetical protein
MAGGRCPTVRQVRRGTEWPAPASDRDTEGREWEAR